MSVGSVVVYDCEFLTAPGAPRRFWCGADDPDPLPIQIGAVRLDLAPPYALSEPVGWDVLPYDRDGHRVPLDPLVTRLTGLTEARLDATGIDLGAALGALADFAQGAPLLAWGKDELLSLAAGLFVQGLRSPIPAAQFRSAVPLLVMAGEAKDVVERLRSHTLCAHFGLPQAGPAHDARGDALSVAAVLKHLLATGRLTALDVAAVCGRRDRGRDRREEDTMRTVYVNGEYLPETEARVSIFDRGFLMADAVYEVTSVLEGKLIDFGGHAVRLQRSLDELDMRSPVTTEELLEVHRELVRLNGIEEGLVYLQITRGAPGDRDFVFPDPETTEPTIVLFTQSKPGLADSPAAKKGIKIISIEDIRWGRRDIKTVQLLYPSMGKMMAKKAGADDAWMVEDGFVTEGTSNNAYIVKGNRIVTRALSHDILHGITRAAVLRYAREAQMEVEERNFTIEEARAADEAFITSASAFVMPVVEIDGVALGDGTPGRVAPRLREIYLEESLKAAV